MNNNYLVEIAGMATYKSSNLKQLDYNKNFFGKYLNEDIKYLRKAIIATQIYSQILRDIEVRYREEDDKKITELEEKNRELNNTIKQDIQRLNDLLNMENVVNNRILDLYNVNNINMESIIKQDKFKVEIEDNIKSIKVRIKPTVKEINDNDNQIKDINDRRIKYDKYIEDNITKLKESLKDLEGKQFFKDVDLDSLKEEYEQGLKEIYPNDITRKVYVDYTFMILKNELNMMNNVLSTGRIFVEKADKIDKYELPEIALQNEQINIFNEIDEEVYQKLMFFINRTTVESDKNNNIEGEKLNNIYQLISSIYDYINNIPEYVTDKETGIKIFNNIVGYYEQSMNNLPNIGDGKIDGDTYQFTAKVSNMFNTELNTIIKNNRRRELNQSMDTSMQK